MCVKRLSRPGRLGVRSLVGLLGLVIGTAPGVGFGSGFSLFEHSVRNTATAYAGGATNAGREPSGLFWNPAGMVLVEGRQRAQLVATYFTFRSEFDDQGSTRTQATPLGPLTAPSAVNGDVTSTVDAFVPSLFWVGQPSERLYLGVGVVSDFGLETTYDDNWVGRYHALDSELETLNINPSLAYRLNDRFSLGLGVSMAYAKAKLSNAIFRATPTGVQLPDGRATLEGSDWSLGFNLGVLFEPSDKTRLGLAYRSRVAHDLNGKRSIRGTGAFDGDVNVSSELTLPDSLIAGVYHRFGERFSLMADAIWSGWSVYDETRVRAADGSPDNVTVHDWSDSWRFTLGGEYALNASWTLRAGLAYDQSPIPDATRTPRIPGADRRWISLGATWQPNERIEVALAYAHLFIDEAKVDQSIDLVPTAPGLVTDRLVGSFTNSSDVVGVQVSLGF